VGLAVDLHEDRVEMPPPLRDLAKLLRPALFDLDRHDRAEAVPPKPDCLVRDVNPALVEQILDVPQRKREADIQHDRRTDDLGRSLEVAKWVGHQATVTPPPLTGRFL